MPISAPYYRTCAQVYAQRWALGRNPLFLDFSQLGGDCTNFISQCLYAGSCLMDYRDSGWYYRSPEDRAPAWTAVEFLYQYLVRQEQSPGPFARQVAAGGLELGDVIQLGDAGGHFYHSLLVTGFLPGQYLVCAHTDNARNRPLLSYRFARARFLHIEGVWWENAENSQGKCPSCFCKLYNGESLI